MIEPAKLSGQIGGWILETSPRAESLELIWQCMLCAMPAGWDVVAHQC